jgi:hypothetical protein
MTITPMLHSPITATPVRCRYLTGNAHDQPRATISPAFHPQTQIARRDITPFGPHSGRPTPPSQRSRGRLTNPASNNKIKRGR